MAASTIKERLHKGYAQVMELKGAPLAEEKSQYQRISHLRHHRQRPG